MPNCKSCAINHRASFLPVKSSIVDLVNIWLLLERSMMKSNMLFECGPHLTSTGHDSFT